DDLPISRGAGSRPASSPPPTAASTPLSLPSPRRGRSRSAAVSRPAKPPRAVCATGSPARSRPPCWSTSGGRRCSPATSRSRRPAGRCSRCPRPNPNSPVAWTGRTSAIRSSGCCSAPSSSTCGGAPCAPPTSTRSPTAARRSSRCSPTTLAPTMPVRAVLAPTTPAPTPPRSGPTPSGPRPPRRPLPLLTRTYDRARTPPPRRSRLPHLLRPFPRRLHRGGHRAAGARRPHDHAPRRVRRGHLVRLDLSLLGPGLLGVVPDPRPDLHGLRGARLRPVDEDALGPAAHAAADVLRRHPRALLLRRALDPPEGRVGSRAPPHP